MHLCALTDLHQLQARLTRIVAKNDKHYHALEQRNRRRGSISISNNKSGRLLPRGYPKNHRSNSISMMADISQMSVATTTTATKKKKTPSLSPTKGVKRKSKDSPTVGATNVKKVMKQQKKKRDGTKSPTEARTIIPPPKEFLADKLECVFVLLVCIVCFVLMYVCMLNINYHDTSCSVLPCRCRSIVALTFVTVTL